MWISKIFAQEFGSSDIHSNYSRTYSWMANQLGHLTLGLALALGFSWVASSYLSFQESLGLIYETQLYALVGNLYLVAGALLLTAAFGVVILAGIARFAIAKFWAPVIMVGICGVVLFPVYNKWLGLGVMKTATGLVPPELTNAIILLLLIAIVLIAIFGLLAVKVISGMAKGIPKFRVMRLYYLPFNWVFQILIIGLFCLAANTILMQEPKDHDAQGVLLAAALFGAVIIMLAKDVIFALIGLLGLFGSVTIAQPEFVETLIGVEIRHVRLAMLGAVIALGLSLTLTFGRRAPRIVLIFYVLAPVVMALLFYELTADLEFRWRVPIASAIASMSVWMTKEFGSDLPGIFDALIKSQQLRGDTAQENLRLERVYINTAFWDVCADGCFYLAGAWIGAGVLTDGWLFGMDDFGAWHEGPEMVGLVVFLVLFLGIGRNWAYRQQAIDRAGLRRGNMLAVLNFNPVIDLYDSTGKVGSVTPEEARETLWYFARGECEARKTDASTEPERKCPGTCKSFKHLVVIGSPVMNLRLANALTTEAALTDLRPEMFARIGNETNRRRARLMPYDLLLRYKTTDLKFGELLYHPLWDHWYAKGETGPKRERLLTAEDFQDAELALKSPKFLAVMGREPYQLEEAFARIVENQTDIEHTAWFFDKDHDSGTISDPIVDRFLDALRPSSDACRVDGADCIALKDDDRIAITYL